MKSSIKENILPPLWILVLLVTALIFWLVSELREIVFLVVISFIVAYLIEPILIRLEENKISRPIGFFIIVGVTLILFALLFVTVFPVLQKEFWQLMDNFPHYLEVARLRIDPLYQKILEKFGADIQNKATESLPNLAKDILPEIFSRVQSTILQGYSITLALVNLALLPFMIFYISMNFKDYPVLFYKIFPQKQRKTVQAIVGEIDTFVSGFIRGQILICFCLFILYAVGLGFVGVDLWFLLAVIAGFGNLIPYLGSVVGIILASLMALITFGDTHHLFYVWGVFAGVQFLEGIFITPKIIGEKTGLSPVTVIIAIFAGGKLFGLLGIFLAVPGAAIVRVLFRYFHGWLLSKV